MFLLLLQTLRLWRDHKGICVYFKKTVILISQLVAFFFLCLHSLLISLSFLLFESQFLSLFSYSLSPSILFLHLYFFFIHGLPPSVFSQPLLLALFLPFFYSFPICNPFYLSLSGSLSFPLILSLPSSHCFYFNFSLYPFIFPSNLINIVRSVIQSDATAAAPLLRCNCTRMTLLHCSALLCLWLLS